jgi:hypothetical protein
MNFSSLKNGQIAVVQIELRTSIVLAPDGNGRLGSGDKFRTFDSLLGARDFAQAVVSANPGVECGLYDANGAHLERITAARPKRGTFAGLAERKGTELLLKLCYAPFLGVGAITKSFYGIAQMDKHPALVYFIVVVPLHCGLFAIWALFFRKVISELPFSKYLATVGLALAYAVGLFVGHLVH